MTYAEALEELRPGDAIVLEAGDERSPMAIEVKRVQQPKPHWTEVVLDADVRLHSIRSSIVAITDDSRRDFGGVAALEAVLSKAKPRWDDKGRLLLTADVAVE